MVRILCLLGLTLVLAPAASAPAGSPQPDGAAPPGAGPDWLPAEEWVMERWVPFNQEPLYTALRFTPDQLRARLTQRESLVRIARVRGVQTEGMVRDLVGQRLGRETRGQWRVRLSHTKRILTQPHLAEHMLFHGFHTHAVEKASPRIYGVSRTKYFALKRQGYSHKEMLEISGMDPAVGFAHLYVVERRNGQRGVRKRLMPPAENALLRRDESRVDMDRWLRYHVPATEQRTVAAPISSRADHRALFCPVTP